MDLVKELKEDEVYKTILENLSDEDRAGVESYMEEYMNQWQTHLFNQLEEQMKDPEYRVQLRKLLMQNYDGIGE
jgi:uncharacterized protein YllA (UPF0747 family)